MACMALMEYSGKSFNITASSNSPFFFLDISIFMTQP